METIYSWQRKLEQRSYIAVVVLFLYLSLVIFLLFLYIVPSADLTSLLTTSVSFALALTASQYYMAYRRPDLVVNSVFEAVPLEETGYRKLERVVERMKTAYGIHNVNVYIVNWDVINAFVVSSPEKHYLYVTKGAIEKLNERELEAVIAHEFAHMENKDSLYLTVAVIVAGLASIISYIFFRIATSGQSERKRSALVFILLALILYLITPIITRIIVSSISKQREYLADTRAVEVTKYPPAMISALYKVGVENTKLYMMEIKKPTTIAALFFDYEDIETHPPIEDRIKRISELTRTPLPPEVKNFVEHRY